MPQGRMTDYSGLKVGKLLIIGLTDTPPVAGYRYWLCRCECGKEVQVISRRFHFHFKHKTSDNSFHCGCQSPKRTGFASNAPILGYTRGVRK